MLLLSIDIYGPEDARLAPSPDADQRPQCLPRQYIPTPEEIEAACQRIRSTWSDRDFRIRARAPITFWKLATIRLAELGIKPTDLT